MNQDLPKKSVALTKGDTIAEKYVIQRVLGEGAMGVVLEAWHKDLHFNVAIKVISPEHAHDERSASQLMREGRTVAGLRSPHVVRVFDVGRLENGSPYIVMECLHGQDLSRVLEEKKALTLLDATNYGLQASEALAEAHAMGIVHRDIKPANLFLAKILNGSDCIKILDFGISTVCNGKALARSAMSQTGRVIGSPLYMAPEQMKAGSLDHRADIWSLGVTLYELASGRPPFEAATIMELCLQVANDEPTPLRLILGEVAEDFDRVVMKCLAKDPSERWPDMSTLVWELQRVRDQLAQQGGGSQPPQERIAGASSRIASGPVQLQDTVPSVIVRNPRPRISNLYRNICVTFFVTSIVVSLGYFAIKARSESNTAISRVSPPMASPDKMPSPALALSATGIRLDDSPVNGALVRPADPLRPTAVSSSEKKPSHIKAKSSSKPERATIDPFANPN